MSNVGAVWYPPIMPTRTRLRDGTTTTDIRLDRCVQFDERSKAFPIRELVGTERPLRPRTWSVPVQLDQGADSPSAPPPDKRGGCTGFSSAMELAAGPVIVTGVDNELGWKIYYRARQLDEWEGEDYEGSSVLGAAKAATEFGYYGEYRWALGPGPDQAEADLATAVSYHGPAIIGSNWYEAMFDADSRGNLVPDGALAGGHAWCVTRFNPDRGYWTPNSWNGAGQGWVSRQSMIRLLSEQGEAMIPVHRHK